MVVRLDVACVCQGRPGFSMMSTAKSAVSERFECERRVGLETAPEGECCCQCCGAPLRCAKDELVDLLVEARTSESCDSDWSVLLGAQCERRMCVSVELHVGGGGASERWRPVAAPHAYT